MTLLLRDYAGSLGSRLHKQDELNYVAYAQWPDKSSWIDSKNKLPESSKVISQEMKDSCVKIKTVYELEVIEDLLSK